MSHTQTLVRTAIPSSAPLTCTPVDANILNDTGINTRSLVDLQRFLLCAKVAAGPDTSFNNSVKNDMKEVVASSGNASARVTLVFKNNVALRTDFLTACKCSEGLIP